MYTEGLAMLGGYKSGTKENKGMQCKYALELEKMIFNWYYGGENAAPTPIFNAIHAGFANNMQVLVPIEATGAAARELNKSMRCKIVENNKPETNSFVRFIENDQGEYYVPIFTGKKEADEGNPALLISMPLKELFDSLSSYKGCNGYIMNPYEKKLMLGKDMIKFILSYEPRSYFEFIRGSVVSMHVGAIVNAANTTLLGGMGVDGAIHEAAGPELLKECKTLHGCKTGEAKITKAYNIGYADHIIHTVGPIYRGKSTDEELLADCYRNSLDLAAANGCSSIAFPCISTGAYGYPKDDAATIAMLAIATWINTHPNVVMNIYACCFSNADLAAYKGIAKEIAKKINGE